MRTIDIARRAARSLRNAKTRTILTSLAIAVGAFTITVSLAAGEGARQYTEKLVSSNVNPQALFIVKDDSLFEGPAQAGIREYDPDLGAAGAANVTVQQMTQADVEALSERDDLSYVTPIYTPKVEYAQFGDDQERFAVGVTTYDPTITSGISAGALPPQGDQLSDTEAVVPTSYTSLLIEQGVIEKPEDLVGMKLVLTASKSTAAPTADEIAVAFAQGGQAAVQELVKPETQQFTYTIIALSSQSSTALTAVTDIQISADSARAISEYTTQGTNAYQKYIGVTALAADGQDPAEVKVAIEKEGYTAQTAEDLQNVIFTVVNTLQGIVLGFGIVALIASVFGIINTQYISVLERTREIGLMKALGMRGKSVSRLFQFEAAWIGFLGGIIGAAIAVVLGTALNPWITETLSLGEGNYILIFQAIPIVVMLLVLVLIAMLAGWFPARKAAKLDPIEALRTE